MLSTEENAQLSQIAELLDEAYRHYFANSDGHCKSLEGAIELELTNFFDRREGAPLRIKSVMVYSYVLGPDRMHYFDSVEEALSTVRQWHTAEMARDYSDEIDPLD